MSEEENSVESSAVEISRILAEIDEGGPQPAERLLPLLYDELRRLARRRLATEPAGQTLQATALVHEAYLRIAGHGTTLWNGRRHFYAAAAEAMRRILVDRARRRRALKRGGGKERLSVDLSLLGNPDSSDDRLLALEDALGHFESIDSLRSQVVKLRFFAGLGIEETAQALDLSVATVNRHWTFARAWLCDRLRSLDAR